MTYTHVIDPLNRVEGDLAIELTIEDNIVTDAKCMGFVYRGLEKIFLGKRPFDAMRLSQRSCGICPVSHGTAGTYAIESTANFEIPRNAELIRDLTLGVEISVSHLTHFYFMWGPDLTNKAYKDNELYPEIIKRFEPLRSLHLRSILKNVKIPLHSVTATFGGRVPHPSHCVPGGVSCFPKQVEINKVISTLFSAKEYVERRILNGVSINEWSMIRSSEELMRKLGDRKFAESDLGLFIKYGQDIGLHNLGEGTSNNFLSYGYGHLDKNNLLFKQGYIEGGNFHTLDLNKIAEDTSSSFYETEKNWRNPVDGVTISAPRKEGAYSWIKSPRYFGHVCELGPLARQIVNGDMLITDLVRTYGVNTYTRTIARLHETLLILSQLKKWAEEIDIQKPFYYQFPEVRDGLGIGICEAPRGGLGHWVTIENSRIKNYQIVTPSTWNCSPKDSKWQHGAVENALVGIRLRDNNSMLEAGHVVRSFDPCISCSIHAVGGKRRSLFVEAL